MATMPIEVILRDAEAPVDPTPTPEQETDISVPETGTISNGNGGGGIGSAASIILPAIIALLAIGAMVALIIRRYQKRKNNTEATKLSKKEKLATAASGTIAILAATALVGNLVIPATNAASDDTNDNTEEGTYLETEDKVSIIATIDKDSKEPTIVTVKDTLYATTDASGYTVTMSMMEDALTSNLYLNGDTESEYYIAPVEESEEDAKLTTNTWGYRLDEKDSYLPVPLADDPATVAEGEEAIEHEEINVYYGLKVDNTLPLGTYSGEIEYNITPVNPIDRLTYMQDFATLSAEEKEAVVGSMMEDKQYYLKDNRDNKEYRISKLKDGNVWMTQNLDLEKEDLLANVVLDSSNTDNPAQDFLFPDSQIEDGVDWGDPHSATAEEINTVHVYDITGTGDKYYRCMQFYDYGACKTYGTEEIPPSELGNLYNWYAATASTGSYSLRSGDVAIGSICPAGWRLPNSSTNSSAITDHSNLLYKYDIYTSSAGEGYDTNKLPEMFTSPLFFMKSGYYDYGTMYKSYIDVYGSIWLSMASGSRNSYVFNFSNRGISKAVSYPKTSGYAVRCIAR